MAKKPKQYLLPKLVQDSKHLNNYNFHQVSTKRRKKRRLFSSINTHIHSFKHNHLNSIRDKWSVHYSPVCIFINNAESQIIALSTKIQLNKIVSSPKSKKTARPMSIVKRSAKVYLFMKIVPNFIFSFYISLSETVLLIEISRKVYVATP